MDDRLEAAAERFDVERPAEPRHDGDVVDGAVRHELVQEPQALLGR
jgi:hypothetical protein